MAMLRRRRDRAAPEPRAQIVCVGLADEMRGAEDLLDLQLQQRAVFSSVGKRTPTPCVRPPEALAGVIQPTLPATG